MRIDHDFHIHTQLSLCAKDDATVENYIRSAKRLGLRKLGFANHMWDSAVPGALEWCQKQSFEHSLVSWRRQCRATSFTEWVVIR